LRLIQASREVSQILRFAQDDRASRSRRIRRNRAGIALIWIAILGMVLVGLAGLALDTGYVMLTGHQLQNAADAAALAGANSVSFDTAQSVTDALATAAANKAAGAAVQLDSASDIIIGVYDRSSHTFTAGSTPPNAVKVIARRTDTAPGGPLNLIFAPMFGITTSNVSRQAIAMTSPLGAGVILLNKSASPSLSLTGTGSHPAKVNVTNGGAVVIDSSSATAVGWNGHPIINASSLYIVGNDTAVQSGGVFPSGSLTLNSQYAPDPLAWLPEPPKGTDRSGASGPNIQPGYYPSGLPTGNLTLAAGVYYIDGGISLGGNTTIDATAGVMIFLHTGGISMSGTSGITINPPTSGTYKGISFYSARGNTSPVTLQGTPGAINSGTFYFPSAHVSIAGNPTSTASQLIADTLDVQGDSQLNINYNNAFPIPRHQSFLVQ
jgi:Flp pilus assembly protein TadG